MTWYDKTSSINLAPLKQGDTLYFANMANRVVAASNDFRSRDTFDIDFAVFKMQKLNLNISANLNRNLDFIRKKTDEKDESLRYTDVLDDSKDFSQGKGKLFDSSRYSYFVREGSGVQGLGNIDINIRPEIISTDDNYHIGGFVNLDETYKPNLIRGSKRFLLPIANFQDDIRRDFTSSSAPGDSGSALYVYDNLDKKWYLIGVINSSNCNQNFSGGYNCYIVNYALINQPLIDEFKDSKTINIGGGNYTFDNDGLKKDGVKKDGVEFISKDNAGVVVFNDDYFIRTRHDNRIKEMEKSKDLYFNQSENILIQDNTDLGAGVLNFASNSYWEISGDKWLINGGIYTDVGAKVIYNAQLKENDYLHKMGQGELEIRSNNIKSGFRMGEGLVSLTTEGKKFGEIYLNGGVLKISNANNIDFNTLYLNGGSLDINGQSLSTNIIKANSNNVFITSSKENAEFNFQGTKDYIYHGNFASDNYLKININNSEKIIFDGNIYNEKGVININDSNVNFQGHPIIHTYLDKQSLANPKKFGQDAFIKGEHIDQNNLENGAFVLKELNLHNAFFLSFFLCYFKSTRFKC